MNLGSEDRAQLRPPPCDAQFPPQKGVAPWQGPAWDAAAVAAAGGVVDQPASSLVAETLSGVGAHLPSQECVQG